MNRKLQVIKLVPENATGIFREIIGFKANFEGTWYSKSGFP